MSDREELLKTIREKRDTAAGVRRLAQRLSLNADRLRLMQQADEIEEEARQLGRQISGNDPAPPLAAHRGMPMQQQQVQQQQQEAEPPPE